MPPKNLCNIGQEKQGQVYLYSTATSPVVNFPHHARPIRSFSGGEISIQIALLPLEIKIVNVLVIFFFAGERPGIDGIVDIIINAWILGCHKVPELLGQGLRIAPLEIILRFIVQEHGQDRDAGTHRDIERAVTK